MQERSCQRNSYSALRVASALLRKFSLDCLRFSALQICFPQIISRGPLGRSGDSRQARCACLTKESQVYKCKHSILPTQALHARRFMSSLLSGAHWLQALLFFNEAICKFGGGGGGEEAVLTSKPSQSEASH